MEYSKQLKKLYTDPDLYEQEYAFLSQDINFWVDYVKNNNIRSLLELGCGSGRIGAKLIPFLEEYSGIDLSDEFLSSFRARLNDSVLSKVNVRIEKHDITRFSLFEKFDLIILPFNTISHLYSTKQVVGMLDSVSEHMNKGAKFIIDCFNPNMTFLATHKERRLCNEFTMSRTQERISVYETNEYFSDTQVNYIKRIYVNHTNSSELELDLPMRMYYPQELNAILELNNYNILKKYGDYSMEPFNSNSQKQIIISCKKQ